MYEFSTAWFFIGIIVIALGVVFARFHQWVADNFGSGVVDYDRYKLWAFITCGAGLLFMTNLHTYILRALLGNIFS